MSRSHAARFLAVAAIASATLVLATLVLARDGAEPGPVAPSWPPLQGRAVWSLLAVGDAGAKPWPIARARQQVTRVTQAMAAEDLRDPVDALVLLGDNFYPDGLQEAELDARVRSNLSEPFCRFLPSTSVACPVPSRPARVLAVLGNHDHESRDSARLQRSEIQRRLPFFQMPPSSVHAMELGRGVSIVLYDAKELLDAGTFEPLRAAVRTAPGPWRILASHYPLTRREADEEGRAAREALASLDVPVHLHLAGHRHYLELARGDRPPFLQAIAGSGSNVRPAKEPLDGSVYQAELPGFARVDLVEGPDGSRLVVSLVALPGGLLASGPGGVAARWSVGLDGGARAEPLAGP